MDEVLKARVRGSMKKAAQAGPFMVAVWRMERGRLVLDLAASNFPQDLHKPAVEGLVKNLVRNAALQQATAVPPSPNGVGTILGRTFAKLGFKADDLSGVECDDCEEATHADAIASQIKLQSCGGCLQLLAEMNTNGPDWCEANITDIVERIKTNASRRKAAIFGTLDKVPFFRATVKRFVLLAIREARRAITAETAPA
jgi:hypothetical protein